MIKVDPNRVLINVVKIDIADDFYQPVQRILEKVGSEKVRGFYYFGKFDNTKFLGYLARRMGNFKKGCIAGLDAAGKIALNDLVAGRISYFAPPLNMMSE